MNQIIDVVNKAKADGLYVSSAHYCTILEGDIHKIFTLFNEILSYGESYDSHFVLQATLSVNSPTKE